MATARRRTSTALRFRLSHPNRVPFMPMGDAGGQWDEATRLLAALRGIQDVWQLNPGGDILWAIGTYTGLAGESQRVAYLAELGAMPVRIVEALRESGAPRVESLRPRLYQLSDTLQNRFRDFSYDEAEANNFGPFFKDGLFALEHAADVFALRPMAPERRIPPDVLNTLQEYVTVARELAVDAAELNPAFRMIVLDLLRDLQRALDDYSLRGAGAFRSTLDRYTGRFLREETVRDASRNGFVKRVINPLLLAAAAITEFAANVITITESELLPWTGAQPIVEIMAPLGLQKALPAAPEEITVEIDGDSADQASSSEATTSAG